jgi:branched-chain amino acid transport system ATP-binding protein
MECLRQRLQPAFIDTIRIRKRSAGAAEVGILEVRNLSKNFGGLMALQDLSFQVEQDEIRGLIGPNGAGKTTIFNLISGFYRPSRGEIRYRGHKISGLPSNQIARRGIVRTFQHTTLFQELTVLQNVLVGRHLLARGNILAAVLGLDRGKIEAAQEHSLAVLDFFGLADRRDEPAANLPHGLQKTLGLAVALAAEPKLLLLDEPFAGMNPEETTTMMGLVRQVRDRGVTVLLVEHDMQAVMGLCDRITVVNFGQLLAEGSPAEIRAHPEVIEAYLGTA